MRGDWQLLLTMVVEMLFILVLCYLLSHLRRYYIFKFVVKLLWPLLHLWSNPYYICGRLLHLWSSLITFVAGYYICGQALLRLWLSVITFVASTERSFICPSCATMTGVVNISHDKFKDMSPGDK